MYFQHTYYMKICSFAPLKQETGGRSETTEKVAFLNRLDVRPTPSWSDNQ